MAANRISEVRRVPGSLNVPARYSSACLPFIQTKARWEIPFTSHQLWLYLQSFPLNFHLREAPSFARRPFLHPRSSPPAFPRSRHWSTPPLRPGPCSSAAPPGQLEDGGTGMDREEHRREREEQWRRRRRRRRSRGEKTCVENEQWEMWERKENRGWQEWREMLGRSNRTEEEQGVQGVSGGGLMKEEIDWQGNKSTKT